MEASNLHSVSVLSDHLIRLFGHCQSLQDACDAFSRVPKRTVFTWNAIISAHMNLSKDYNALLLYAHMQKQGVIPNKVTFLFVLKACSNLDMDALRKYGRVIHHQILFLGNFSSEVAISNMLIHMYAKSGCLREARSVFCGLESENLQESESGSRFQRDSISWSALISGYAQHGCGHSAFALYEEMLEEGIQPDKSVLSSILNACGSIHAIHQGRQIHDQICRHGIALDVVVEGTLIDMYVKCGEIWDARRVFDRLPNQDCISWSTMILGYAQHGHGILALKLFVEMQQNRIHPDRVTYLNVVKACSLIGGLEEGRLVHEYLIRDKFERHVVLGNAIVDMYGNCGGFEDACKVFNELPNPDIVSWSVVISGYAERGEITLVKESLNKMADQGIEPDDIMFMSMLSVFTHIGSVKEGCVYFKYMMSFYGLIPTIEHYNSMIDLLGRTGCLKEAESMLLTMPIPPDIVTCTSLLASCKAFNDMDVGNRCLLRISEINFEEASSTHGLLSSEHVDS